ncbi:Sec23-binding domain of Sec16-domain-containing protein [Xylariomycetidae sp. FL0641]|nr:Sec23-binding domain of Sec16-domain-containing protein [Xylariomycetidae sp. FL0641]
MQSDTPHNASWHPAMMPNFNPESQPSTVELEKAPDPTLSSPPPPAYAEKPSDNADASHDDTPHEAQPASDGAFLNQFNDDDDSAAAAWDLSEPAPEPAPEPAQEAAVERPHEDPSSSVEPVTEEAEPESEPVSTNKAKHTSTTSFARTVSQEMSFSDDESEWTLPRTDTDPFKFMPPNDRTNSFPVVPQAGHSTAQDHPPPMTQAEEIIQEIEKEADHADPAAHQSDFPKSFDDRQESKQVTQDAQYQQLGGDLVGTQEQESEARFEEGLPLIPQEPEVPVPKEESGPPASKDPFALDDGADAGDDFFSQITGQPTSQEASFDRSLHRKSTTMVIGKTMDPVTGASTLDSNPPTPIEEMAANTRETLEATAQAQLAEATETVPEGKLENEGKVEDEVSKPAAEDVDAKWAAAFGDDDDDDFLAEPVAESKELDPADVFGSDDEGFLEDTEDHTGNPPAEPPMLAAPPPAPQSSNSGRYTPATVQSTQPPANPYAPASTLAQIPPPLQQQPSFTHPGTAPPMATGFGMPPPPKPELPKAQSFVGKSKAGYQSPYDLPMQVVKPKKRASALQGPQANAPALVPPPPAGPPRSTSMYAQVPPPPLSGGSKASPSPTLSQSSQQPALSPQKTTPQLKPSPSFFEDLPMTSKPRSVSRQSGVASPLQSPYGPPQAPPRASSQGPPLASPPMASPAMSLPPPRQSSQDPALGISSLVPPEPVNPYAQVQSNPQVSAGPAPAPNNRYSPAPPGAAPASAPAAAASRYSPAPPISRTSSGNYSAVPPPVLPHQPRTSSPLAHFETTREKQAHKLPSPVNTDAAPLNRANSSQYEPRITRVSSLPPTQEVEEEQSPLLSPPGRSNPAVVMSPPESKYAPSQALPTPPPMGIPPSNPLSPPKRSMSNYMPHSAAPIVSKEVNFVPPPRSQTQSPGAVYGNRANGRAVDPVPRPSSVQGDASRDAAGQGISRPTVRARGMSQHLNLVPPTDGRELDPLQRWRGAPTIAWGVGGLFVSSFPKDVPRYGMGSSLPQMIRSPGEVHVKHVREIQPLEERLAKFPGPLKGKSKKKDTVAWLNAGIEGLERDLPNVSFQQYVSHEDKRAVERVLLWKMLRVMIENDGVLEGNPTVDNAVREIISPGVEASTAEVPAAISAGVDLTGISSTMSAVQADAVDSTAIEQVRKLLLAGDREKAVWAAADKRLWGHAMLISNTMQSAELYKQVAQEFIKKEVNHPGHGNESLAALYAVLSGNFEESVDELVPSHARAGLQLMSTSAAVGGPQDALAGLDKWRETLGLILSNRSHGDAQSLRSLGNLLSGYGRAEAAHICYIFAKHFAIFGGLDDPNANFVLVGADHRQQADQFAKDTEALQLSEVYEYGLSLAAGSAVAQSSPHLAAYKLQHAMTLAEHGFRDKALEYCEGIFNAMSAQTKRSPYYNPILETAVDDLMRRLKQTPKEESSSWLPKPKMDQVSSSMWNRFNKFVAGDDEDGNANGAGGEGELGPFARIGGGTPTISRSPSVSNFEPYGASGPSPTAPATKAASRYAPVSQIPGSPYAPSRSSMERTSGEMRRGSYDLQRQVSNTHSTYSNPYAPAPDVNSSLAPAFQPSSLGSSGAYAPVAQNSPPAPLSQQPSGGSNAGYQPYDAPQLTENASPYQPYGLSPAEPPKELQSNDPASNSGYQPPSSGGYAPPSLSSYEPPAADAEASSGGYEPPSFQPSSFEPPSYEPGSAEDADPEDKPKKKSIMDDDEDDIPALKPAEKSKAEKDRENAEMFRKVAEEEAKRAAEAKPAKKGWLGGWFGGGGAKDKPAEPANKPIKAKLGEASSFVYDPDLKRWVNKKPGAENIPAKSATPPPPRSASRNGTPPPPGASSGPPLAGPPPLNKAMSVESLNVPGAALGRTISNTSISSAPGGPPSAPPSRPGTSLSNASSIDDLLGAAGPRKGAKKPRKSGRYVDVMAK